MEGKDPRLARVGDLLLWLTVWLTKGQESVPNFPNHNSHFFACLCNLTERVLVLVIILSILVSLLTRVNGYV